jgi:hypothetical protein
VFCFSASDVLNELNVLNGLNGSNPVCAAAPVNQRTFMTAVRYFVTVTAVLAYFITESLLFGLTPNSQLSYMDADNQSGKRRKADASQEPQISRQE